MWQSLVDWLQSLGPRYGVDPVIYAVLYVACAPFFFGSLAWLIRRLRHGEPWALPAAIAAFFFVLPTLYIVVASRDVPVWAWAIVVGLTGIGVITAIRRIRNGLREPD